MNLIYLYYFAVSLLMILVAYLYGRKTKEWKWSEYFVLSLAPLAGLTFLIYLDGFKMILFFLACCLGGFCAEFFLGFFGEKILGQKMWIYQKFSVLGYTSLLSLPFWGGLGLAFWILGRLFGF